jgi:DNA-binding NtrC family response regulator
MKKILIIDDEVEMLKSLDKILSYRKDFNLTLIDNPVTGNKLVQTKKFDLIITDLKMKEISGLDILKSALDNFPESNVIMISGYGTIEASVEAMRRGAFDFVEKPFTSKKLFDCIDKVFKEEQNKEKEPVQEAKSDTPFEGIIYKSENFQKLLEMVRKIAPGSMNILITGESGTGKELIARAIHKLGKNKSDPFVPVNCGALPESLFESELFGHEKGAFTGAVKTKPGLLEFANNGTFFLDEIGELSPSLQVKLLRMLEDKKIRRVGGQNEINIDVRIISASNRDLKQAVNDKSFREDLFYRLSTIQIEIPPLRERVNDIIPLAQYFVREICRKEDVPVRKFSPDAENILKEYPWPGNIRELQNIIGRTLYLCSSNVIQSKDLPIPTLQERMNTEYLNVNYKEAKNKVIEQFEIEYLSYHLRKNAGNISHTAEACGIDRRTIHRLIKQYNIIYKDRD